MFRILAIIRKKEKIEKSKKKKKKKKIEVKLGSQVAKRCWSSRRLEDIC